MDLQGFLLVALPSDGPSLDRLAFTSVYSPLQFENQYNRKEVCLL
jgi:hypothetical protein